MSENSIYNPKLKWYNLPDKIEFIKILQDQGISKFDPVAFYKEANMDEILKEQNAKLTKKQKKKMKKSNSAKLIIANNIKRKELNLRDEENRKIDFYLRTLKENKDKKMKGDILLSNMSSKIRNMSTNYGKIKLKISFLKWCLDSNVTLGQHLLFFSLSSEKENLPIELKKEYSQIILEYKGRYKSNNLIKIQMTDMSSYLPPLDPFKKEVMKLDDWQIQVFKYIEEKKNILIVAPTSAGKTVCSTYCAVSGNKTLFVVPSDELARQVAGIFRNMGLKIGLITNNEYFIEDNFTVLVGTPYKLEEYLIFNGYDDFNYVIYDEIQMLNAEEGNSFEKIIKLMKCPLLALSATIENPIILKNWLEKIKGETVELIKYSKRFIVQQRYLWEDDLTHLHPLSCVDSEYLNSDEFLKSEMSFTARDSYDLYEKIKELEDSPNKTDNFEKVKSANAIFNKSKWDHITLNDTVNYEKYLKGYLSNLAKTDPKTVDAILSQYNIEDKKMKIDLIKIIKTLFHKKMTPAIVFKLDSVLCQQIFVNLIDNLEKRQSIKYPYHYDDLELQYNNYRDYLEENEKMQSKLIVPQDTDPIIFIEQKRRELEEKYLGNLKIKYNKIITKRIKTLREDVEMDERRKEFYIRYYTSQLNKTYKMENLESIDKNRPHPEFIFSDIGITSDMMRKIRRRLKQGLGYNIDWTHPFLRGIERGIAPYFKNMSTPFQLIVQSLYSRKIIQVVISDDSLAYGINMPIRTTVILGNDQIEEIDTLKASQMSGRSGRRGIDNEGNILYVNINWREILKGTYAPLEGCNPIDNHLALPLYFKKLGKQDIMKLSRISLKQFINNESVEFKDQIKKVMSLVNKNNFSKHPINARISWSCRRYGDNSFLLPLIIGKLLDLRKSMSVKIDYEIIRLLSSLFDTDGRKLTDEELDCYYLENYMTKYINISDFRNIYDGEELLRIYKGKHISSDKDIIINRLRKIGNVIIAIAESIKSTNYRKLTEGLHKTFENIQGIVNKYKF